MVAGSQLAEWSWEPGPWQAYDTVAGALSTEDLQTANRCVHNLEQELERKQEAHWHQAPDEGLWAQLQPWADDVAVLARFCSSQKRGKKKKKQQQQAPLPQNLERLVLHVLHNNLASEYGGPLDELSFKYYNADGEYDAEDCMVEDGMDSVVRQLLQSDSDPLDVR